MKIIELVRYPMIINTVIVLVLIIEALVRLSLQLRNNGNWYLDKAKVIEYCITGIFISTSFMFANFLDFTFNHFVILSSVIILCGFVRSLRKT